MARVGESTIIPSSYSFPFQRHCGQIRQANPYHHRQLRLTNPSKTTGGDKAIHPKVYSTQISRTTDVTKAHVHVHVHTHTTTGYARGSPVGPMAPDTVELPPMPPIFMLLMPAMPMFAIPIPCDWELRLEKPGKGAY